MAQQEELEKLERRRHYRKLISASYTSPVGVPPPKLSPEQAASLEDKFCYPDEVEIHELLIHPKGGLTVHLMCPGGAYRKRNITQSQMKCYIEGVEEKEEEKGRELDECEKTEVALNCMDGAGLTPTLMEAVSGDEVPRGRWREGEKDLEEARKSVKYRRWRRLPWKPTGAAKCLVDLSKEDKAIPQSRGWELVYYKPPTPKRMGSLEEWEFLKTRWFAGEPIYTAPRENWSHELYGPPPG